MTNCHRKSCTRTRSEFRNFLKRRRPPQFDHQDYCSEICLRTQMEMELQERWRRLQHEKSRRTLRPRLGTILLERSFITPGQLEAAVKMQRQNCQGRLGEWLLRLGFIEEHQITIALSRQFGIPVIHLQNAVAQTDAARLVPGHVAKCANLVPVGYDDDGSSLRVAASGPVDFGSQDAIRRMSQMGVRTFIGDESAIQALLEQLYSPEELDLSGVSTYGSLPDLVEITKDILATAMDRRALNIQYELVDEYFWVRIDFESAIHHRFYRYQGTRAPFEERVPMRQWSLAAVPVQ